MNKINLSILIVHYKNEKDLVECLDSFYKFKPKISFEILIVDNSENRNAIKKLARYENLRYILSPKNVGYGSGMNLGAKHARGEYIFILNPDVIFTKNIVDDLVYTLKKDSKAAIVAPLLLDINKNIMDQGAKDLSPLTAIFKYSFLDKIWPQNSFSKNYWVKKWQDKIKSVDNVPGTAFIVKKSILEKLGGFDENFFLYFEEFDLCKRVRALGYKIYIDPRLKLMHKWGTTTKMLPNKDKIFKQSRFKYFKKHYGLIKALSVESFLLLTPINILFLLVLSVSLFVRLYRVDISVLNLIGDQGWFYLSAKDLLLLGKIPLVGITSSHVWLHQGPLWTYVLAGIFFFTRFNPLAPAVFTALLDIFTMTLLFVIVKDIFNEKAAIISSIIYGFSPLIILGSRMPYHTSLIPLLILLFFYSLSKWIKGSSIFFSVSILIVSLLYNFELQTTMFYFFILTILLFGFYKKTSWSKKILNYRTISLSFVFFIIPLIPVLIYDTTHRFSQTIVFGGWIIYQFISVFTKHTAFNPTVMINYFGSFYQKLLFGGSSIISWAVLAISVLYFIYKTLSKKLDVQTILLLFLFVFTFIGIFLSKTPSDAYLYSLIIPSVLIVSIFLSQIVKNYKTFFAVILILLTVGVFNLNFYFHEYVLKNNIREGYLNRVQASKFMAINSNGQSYKIIGKGAGSQFDSFTDNYKYLSWYFGGKPEENGKITYLLYETPYGIKIIKKD